MRYKFRWLLLSVFFIYSSAFSKNSQHLNLATTAWCPYTCTVQDHQFGIIGHYITDILGQQGIDVNIASYPWSRAISLANQQAVDGLLTATPAEAPQLLFSTQPITNFQVCFYTRKEVNWRFNGDISLGNQKLGIIQDYGYGEPLDSFIKNDQASTQIVSVSGENGLARLMTMLINKRVDIIVDDKIVVNAMINGLDEPAMTIKQAGCMSAQPFYLALTPVAKHQKLMPLINAALANSANQTKLTQLLSTLAL